MNNRRLLKRRLCKSLLQPTSLLLSIYSFPVHATEREQVAALINPHLTKARVAKSGRQKVVTGRLTNGLRFAILPRKGNEPGTALLMRDQGGFIAERRPGERGLAHLIEHVVFRSPTIGSPDDLGHFTRLGLQLTFPAAQVATTTWRESNFFLSSKTARIDDLDGILTLFREAASDLTFRADAVNIERDSVMREMADKKLGNRIYADYIAAIAPGSPNDVIDAQNSDDVPTASIETLRGLYHRLYQPKAMMIVMVGDVEPRQMKALIKKRFGDWKRTGPAAVKTPVPVFQPGRIRPISYSAFPQGRRTVTIGVVLPTPAPQSSRAAQARAKLMDLIAVHAIDDRLAAAQPASPSGWTGLFIDNSQPGHRQIEVWDGFTSDQWWPAVTLLRQVTCALKTAGFKQEEWMAAKREVAADLERGTVNMAEVPNVEIAKDLSHALADGRALIQPDELLRYAGTMLPAIDARAGSRWWQRQWHSGAEHIRVEGPELADITDPIPMIRAAADGAIADLACKVRR